MLSAQRSVGVCERSAWSASRPVALWCFLALRYCVRDHFRASGGLWFSGNLKGAMRAPLHMLVVLLCPVYIVCSCSLLFKAPHPNPPFIIIFFIWLFHCSSS